MKTEAKIQQEIVVYFRNNYQNKGIIFSVPNETSSYLELKSKRNIGLLSGVSDLIVILNNKILFVEVKTPIGKQSKTQIFFEDHVRKLGFDYFIVRNLQEFKEIFFN